MFLSCNEKQRHMSIIFPWRCALLDLLLELGAGELSAWFAPMKSTAIDIESGAGGAETETFQRRRLRQPCRCQWARTFLMRFHKEVICPYLPISAHICPYLPMRQLGIAVPRFVNLILSNCLIRPKQTASPLHRYIESRGVDFVWFRQKGHIWTPSGGNIVNSFWELCVQFHATQNAKFGSESMTFRDLSTCPVRPMRVGFVAVSSSPGTGHL